MAFTVPEFPLAVDIYAGPWLTRALRLSTVCNLAFGRRGTIEAVFQGAGQNVYNGPAYVLFPPATDVRDLNCNQVVSDLLEIPSGSGRWYSVGFVDDIGKGFPNEHRYAAVSKISANVDVVLFPGLFWPSPIP